MLGVPRSMAMAMASPPAAAAPASSSASSPSTSSSSTSSPSSLEGPEKKYVQKYLTNCKSFYSCIYCRTHLANHDELVSRSFQGNHGRAYLFNTVINVSCGPAMQRELNTGAHAVADIYCSNCETTLGWKYEKAYVKTQKYKEGKYIIELAHVVRENKHLELDKRDEMFLHFHRQNKNSDNSCSISKSSPDGSGTSGIGSPQSSTGLLSSPRSTGSSSPPSSSSSSSSPSSSYSSPHSSSSKPMATTNASSTTHNQGRSIRDILDDDLMFPYYDDLCLDDNGQVSGSFVGSFSSACLHNRIRRSLYLDSKPYDWKYSTRSSDLQQKQSQASENNANIDNNNKSLISNLSPGSSSQDNAPKLMQQQSHQSTSLSSSDRPPASTSADASQSGATSTINCVDQSSTEFGATGQRNNARGADYELDSADNECLGSIDEQQHIGERSSTSGRRVAEQVNCMKQQVDESEIQFNFEADTNIVYNNDHGFGYLQHPQQQEQHNKNNQQSGVEQQCQVTGHNDNRQSICDPQQQQVELESSLTLNSNSSGDNRNDNELDNNIDNTIRQQPARSINYSNAEPNQKPNLGTKKPPKLGNRSAAHQSSSSQQQSSTAAKKSNTTSRSSTVSSSFSFDDEEFYDCYTS